jgi:hypothetical protein
MFPLQSVQKVGLSHHVIGVQPESAPLHQPESNSTATVLYAAVAYPVAIRVADRDIKFKSLLLHSDGEN